jgi:sulfane dehydrogenase subunit SoxC
MTKAGGRSDNLIATAGNGLIGRRALLGGLTLGAAGAAGAASAESIRRLAPDWMLSPGEPLSPYGSPAPSQTKVTRILAGAPAATGSSRTPLHLLEGTITPNSLHFERHHNGVPDIDPAKHELVIHGLVKRPLSFTRETLSRYPMESRIRFLECAGNSGALVRPQPQQASAGTLHGLISGAEWTGVPLSILLDEAGVYPSARWVIAEGADAAVLSRSIPMAACLDDAIIALYQNGEALRPEQGFPMRLFLPGLEGNMNIKWLRRLNVAASPVRSRDETSRYTELQRDGKARQFSFVMGPKSVILKPSFGLSMAGRGLYEISGLAWAGAGKVAKVEVSADAGASWAEAALSEPVLSKALTRFRLLWRWDGGPAVLMSRTVDEAGEVQPTRADWMAPYASGQIYHYNAIQNWKIDQAGQVTNVYA